ncbi:pRiA4b ORF-3-like protein [Rhizobiales bacterium GAS113]|nr:pRiA4b ORF-3-like protein [Rhizobiales bacterium GAS113]
MKRLPKQPLRKEDPASCAANVGAIVQVKIWLLDVGPMVWRRVLVPSSCTLGELPGVFQVAMGWEGIHLYQFCLRAVRYGSWEASAHSADVTLGALRFRKGARFIYAYDLNIPWRHEVRIEDRLEPEPGKAYPACIGGNGTCPPEDCGGPTGFLAGRDDMLSLGALEDTTPWPRSSARLRWNTGLKSLTTAKPCGGYSGPWSAVRRVSVPQGRPFSQRTVNARLRRGEHRDLMRQQD